MFHDGTLSGCDTQTDKHVMVEIRVSGVVAVPSAVSCKNPPAVGRRIAQSHIPSLRGTLEARYSRAVA